MLQATPSENITRTIKEEVIKKVKQKIKKVIIPHIPDQNSILIEAYEGYNEHIKNPFEVWEEPNGYKYIKMSVVYGDGIVYTYFDYDCLNKVKKYDVRWCISSGYAKCRETALHNVIMNFENPGKSGAEITVDHIDRVPMNNKKSNLRLATIKEQLENIKGRVKGTKKERQYSARDLPEGITQEMMPQLVNYRDETNKKYFVIEEHPIHVNKITINGNLLPKAIKSIQALYLPEDETDESMDGEDIPVIYPFERKLEEIIIKLNKLNEVYENWNKVDKNIIIEGDSVIDDIFSERSHSKTIYLYKSNWEFECKLDSVTKAAKYLEIADATIRRNYFTLKDRKLYESKGKNKGNDFYICKRMYEIVTEEKVAEEEEEISYNI